MKCSILQNFCVAACFWSQAFKNSVGVRRCSRLCFRQQRHCARRRLFTPMLAWLTCCMVFFTSYTLIFVVACIAFLETFMMIFFILHIHACALTFAVPCPLYEQLLSCSAPPRCVTWYIYCILHPYIQYILEFMWKEAVKPFIVELSVRLCRRVPKLWCFLQNLASSVVLAHFAFSKHKHHFHLSTHDHDLCSRELKHFWTSRYIYSYTNYNSNRTGQLQC